jgi:hypothetical protein
MKRILWILPIIGTAYGMLIIAANFGNEGIADPQAKLLEDIATILFGLACSVCPFVFAFSVDKVMKKEG